MRTPGEIALPLVLDPPDGRSLTRRLGDRLRTAITDAVVAPGEPLPASRALARQLGVSRGTVVAAYDQLIAEGYLSAHVGRHTVVNPNLRRVHPARPGPPLSRSPAGSSGPAIDLRPGRPWTAEVTTAAWRTAWREAAATALSPLPVAGLPALRVELADHLRRMRGVVRDPGQVFVTAGARDGLAWLLHALGPGLRVGVEDPGYPSLRRVPARLGCEVVPLATDADGLVCDALPSGASAPRVVIVTPSHQYPLGGSLPVARRYALLEWAADQDAWIVEDDYDSELRYTSAPLPALASLDDPEHGRVVTLGTFAKTLGPGLGAGYLLAPARLGDDLEAVRADLGQPVSQTTQSALAAYLASGQLRRHIQRMRRVYRRRRQAVLDAFAGLPGVSVNHLDGGLHAVVTTPVPEVEVLARARRAGVQVAGLGEYWSRLPAHAPGGIALGYGGVGQADLERGLAILAALCGPD